MAHCVDHEVRGQVGALVEPAGLGALVLGLQRHGAGLVGPLAVTLEAIALEDVLAGVGWDRDRRPARARRGALRCRGLVRRRGRGAQGREQGDEHGARHDRFSRRCLGHTP